MPAAHLCIELLAPSLSLRNQDHDGHVDWKEFLGAFKKFAHASIELHKSLTEDEHGECLVAGISAMAMSLITSTGVGRLQPA